MVYRANQLVLIALLSMLNVIVFAQQPSWQPLEQVSANSVVHQFPTMDIDSAAKPVIACNEIIPNKKFDIFLYEKTNGAWTARNITNTDLISDYQPVIKIDSQNNRHILFLSRIADKDSKLFVFYSMVSAGGWSTATCITLGKTDQAAESRPSVIIDQHDNVHVVFHDDNGKLFYISKRQGNWSALEQITTANDEINWYPSLAVDKKDILHLAYLGGKQRSYSVCYLEKPVNGNWSVPEKVVPPYWQPWHLSMTVDSKGENHIVFACDTALQRNIAYLKGYSGHWSELVRICIGQAENDNPSIIVDRKDNVHIAYNGGMGGNDGPFQIYYTNNVGGNFKKPLNLTNTNIFCYYPCLAMDKKGNGYISYYGFDGAHTQLFMQKTNLPLAELKDISSPLPFTSYSGHKRRYLPPLDLNIIPEKASVLAGKTITISAGHGGLAYLAEYRYGCTNTREDEINYGVADYLRNYLEQAKVKVYMCRTTDVDVDLDERPGLANSTNSDLFISIHHNAFDFFSNYASVYFHGNPDDNPVSVDLARMVNQNLSDYMNIPTIGVMSDYYSYWNAGYAELRGLKGRPGILGEGSHFYCYEEEEQLRNKEYLKREAYAYFKALIQYYSLDHPMAKLISPDTIYAGDTVDIKMQLNDGEGKALHKIIPSSIQLKIDGNSVPYEYNWRTGILTYHPVQTWILGTHIMSLKFSNYDKLQSAIAPFSIEVKSRENK